MNQQLTPEIVLARSTGCSMTQAAIDAKKLSTDEAKKLVDDYQAKMAKSEELAQQRKKAREEQLKVEKAAPEVKKTATAKTPPNTD